MKKKSRANRKKKSKEKAVEDGSKSEKD